MDVFSVNEAKTQLGNLLLKSQRAPVQFNKNGKHVAVIISMDEYESNEALRLQLLQSRAIRIKNIILSSNTIDGESFFEAL